MTPRPLSPSDGTWHGAPHAPRHVAVVIDALRAADGHGGAEALRQTVLGCREHGVGWLSVLLPIAHNGNSAACGGMLRDLRQFVRGEAAALSRRGVRLAPYPDAHAHGRDYNGTGAAVRAFLRALRSSAGVRISAESLRVHFGVGCGGRGELVAALQWLAREAAAGRLQAAQITVGSLEAQLSARVLPPVDLLIRTGGSRQISDFLLWQAAYAELLFVEAPWTEFGREQFDAALSDYARRQRTFGALPVT